MIHNISNGVVAKFNFFLSEIHDLFCPVSIVGLEIIWYTLRYDSLKTNNLPKM